MPGKPTVKPQPAAKKKRKTRRLKTTAPRNAAEKADGRTRLANLALLETALRAQRRQSARRADTDKRHEFLRGLLAAAPDTNLAAVRAAWKAAGHTAAIPGSLFYRLRAKFRPRAKPPAARRAPSPAGMAQPHGGFEHIERELDRLLALAPDPQIAELLRAARRRASLALLQRR